MDYLAGLFGVAALVMLACYVSFLMAERIAKIMGVTGRAVITRMLGIILAALAVQFVIDGLSRPPIGMSNLEKRGVNGSNLSPPTPLRKWLQKKATPRHEYSELKMGGSNQTCALQYALQRPGQFSGYPQILIIN